MPPPQSSRLPLIRRRDARGTTSQRRSFRAFMQHLQSTPGALLDRLWADADALVSSGRMLKDGDRCTVVRVEHAGRPMVLKRFNLKGPLHTAVHAIMRSRAAWCWRSGMLLRSANVLTPQPLAYFEERRAGLLRHRSYLLTEFVSGTTLRELIQDSRPDAPALRAIAEQFVRIWQDLGSLRLGHGDMKATNFIVDPDGKLWLIDLDGMRTYPPGPLLHGERRKDISRFMRNWSDQPVVAATFRARLGTG